MPTAFGLSLASFACLVSCKMASSPYQITLSRLANTSDIALPGVLDKLLPRLVTAAASASPDDLPQLFNVINYIKKRLTAGPTIHIPFRGLADIVHTARGSSLQALGIFLRLGKDRLQFPRDNSALLSLAANLNFKDQSSPLICELLILVRQAASQAVPRCFTAAFQLHSPFPKSASSTPLEAMMSRCPQFCLPR